jgi:Uma2 family endonuclease
MTIALAGINPPLRIVPDEPMSLDDFWRFSAENPELRLEREPNGDVVLMSPTLGGAGFLSTSVLGQLFVWPRETALDMCWIPAPGSSYPTLRYAVPTLHGSAPGAGPRQASMTMPRFLIPIS